jgi:hypothetical protein
MKLSTEQISIIKETVNKSLIKLPTLKDDIIDHLCCVVEIKMDRQQNFDSAFEDALHDLAPDGLDEVYKETIFLLNSTKIIIMKRFMYLIGLVSAMSFVTGWTFAMLHLPGQAELSVGGFLGFAFIFMPMYAIDYFKVNIQRALSEKLKLVTGIASALVVATSIIFKLFHLQGAYTLLLIGAIIFTFGFLPFLFFNMYKKSIS